MAEENQPVVVGRDVVKTFKDFWGRVRQLSAMKEIIKADNKTTIFVNPDIKPFDLFKVEEKTEKKDK